MRSGKISLCGRLPAIVRVRRPPAKEMKKFLKIFAVIAAGAAAAVVAFTVYAAAVTKNAAFDKNKIVFCESGFCFFDGSGRELADGGKESFVPLSAIPENVKNAFIAIEDKRFYSHGGVDYRRIAGAALKNALAGKYAEGASTISQQLIKNTHLTNEKTLKRKLTEIKLTLQMEKRLSKDDILQAYLNTIYFGEGAYGIENAARVYFGKSASDLTLAEGATLAAAIKAPAVYSPLKHRETSTKRRNLVLKCMREQGFISADEEAAASDETLTTAAGEGTANGAYIALAREEAEDILSSLHVGFYDSFRIYTYYDKEADDALSEETAELPPCNRAAILIDNATHGITAVAADVGFPKRNPASTVKPWLVYAPAIEEGLVSSATKILDEKTDFNGYSPSAYKDRYYGYVSVKDALSKSLNVPAVKVADCLGMKKMKEYAMKMNVNIDGGLGVALGGIDGGMTIKEIADCYSPFASGGIFNASGFVKRIETADGKTVYERNYDNKRVFSASTTEIINDILGECAAAGTAKKLADCGLPLHAKTGTNGNEGGNYDAYTVSYCKQFTLGLWVGNADNSPMSNEISGGTYPAVVSAEIWKKLGENRKITDVEPSGAVSYVRLDKRSYEEDQIVAAGEDGPVFPFAKGSEPLPPLPCDARLSDVKQFLKDGKYVLSFTLTGADGARIRGESENGRVIEGECVGRNCTFTASLDEQTEYRFTVTPYTVKDGNKVYGKGVTLAPVKYKKQKSPPPSEWWRDD